MPGHICDICRLHMVALTNHQSSHGAPEKEAFPEQILRQTWSQAFMQRAICCVPIHVKAQHTTLVINILF